jgi:hypothetical protein
MVNSNSVIDATTETVALPNLYADPKYLDVVAKVFFPSRRYTIEDFIVDGKVFRLLTLNRRPLVRPQPFIDMHEPVPASSSVGRLRKIRRLAGVSHAIVGLDEFRNDPAWIGFYGAPTVLWAGFEQWNDYEQLLRKRKVLADDRRRWRRLEEMLGPLVFTSDDLRNDVLTTCFAWKSERYRKLKRNLFAEDQTREFFRELQACGLLRVSTLRAGSKLLGIWLGVVYGGRWYGLVLAFNPEKSLSKYSVGRQLLYPMLEESYREGHLEFDFSIGFESYKRYFATHVRAIRDQGLPALHTWLYLRARNRLNNWPWLYEKAKTLKSEFSSYTCNR